MQATPSCCVENSCVLLDLACTTVQALQLHMPLRTSIQHVHGCGQMQLCEPAW